MRPQDTEDQLRAAVETALDSLREARQRGEHVRWHRDRLHEALTAFSPMLTRRMPQRERGVVRAQKRA